MAQGDGTIQIDDAEITYRNFAGNETDYNPAGARNFSIILADDLARVLERDGWNVKTRKDKNTGEVIFKHLPVAVKYRGRDGKPVRPPVVWMITSKGRTPLDESTIEVLDYVDIAKIDVIVRPYSWNMHGNTGVKAYLKTLFFFVSEDALELRYRDVPEIGKSEQLAIEADGKGEFIEGEAWFEDDDDQKAIER